MGALDKHKIGTIEVVVVNLYPFYEKVSSSSGISFEDAIENIDIGGPTMIRAAAKVINLNLVAFVFFILFINMSHIHSPCCWICFEKLSNSLGRPV